MTTRRKRLLIALAAIVALSAGFWWISRPVIDPRLVGTWKRRYFVSNALDDRHIFFDNGTAVLDSNGARFPFRWTVNDDVLTINFGGFWEHIDDLLQPRLGRRVFTNHGATTRYRLSFPEPGQFEISTSDRPSGQQFDRVPD